jgi:hypothetical protein
MTNSLERSSLDSLYDLLDSLKDPLETSRNERTRINRLYARSFSALGYFDNNETKQTEIIGSLLSPKGTHGQGTLFLRHLLTKVWPSTKVDEWPEEALQRVRIYREHYIDCDLQTGKSSRRIDLWLHVDNHRVLAIESKAKDAVDQWRQVDEYLRHMKQVCSVPYKLLYLSWDGSQPSSDSITAEDWTQARDFHVAEAHCYADFIRDWLGRCKAECESDRVRFFIEDLIAFVDSSDERLTMHLDKICPEILSLLSESSANKLMEARRDTLLSIWEHSGRIFDEIMGIFQSNLCSRLSRRGMEPTVEAGSDLTNETWGVVEARIAPDGNGAPYVAVQRCPPGSHRQDNTHFILGINVTGLEQANGLKQWKEVARRSKLGKGTGDAKWIWQEIPQGFENLRSKDAAMKLLDPKTADDVVARMQDCLRALDEVRQNLDLTPDMS